MTFTILKGCTLLATLVVLVQTMASDDKTRWPECLGMVRYPFNDDHLESTLGDDTMSNSN